MYRTLLALAGILLVQASEGRAQNGTDAVTPGQRVRIRGGTRPVIGTLLSADSTSMQVLTSHTDTAYLRRADVTGLDVSVGQKSKTLSGALIGAAVGAGGVGLITYLLAGTPALDSGDESLVYVAAGAVGGLVLGAGVGAVVGAGTHTDRWEPTVWPTLAVRLAGSAGKGIAAGVRISF